MSDTPDPTPIARWREVLANVTGHVTGGEERIATAELLKLLRVPADTENSTRLGQAMRALGWEGPKTLRVGGKAASKGYHRPAPGAEPEDMSSEADESAEQSPAVPAPVAAPGVPVIRIGSEELAHQLERVCDLSLNKIEEILSLPTDAKNGNVLRAQSAVASTAIQCQLRADESKMRIRSNSDTLARLEKLLRSERRKLPKKVVTVAPEPTEELFPDAHEADDRANLA
jgi:hypothetical protein